MKINYHDHLWMEQEIKSVAYIRQYEIREFLPLTATIPLRPTVATHRLQGANQSLLELKRGQIKGAKVLVMDAGLP